MFFWVGVCLAIFTIIGDVSEELRRQLTQSLDNSTELDFNVNPTTSIVLGPPDAQDSDNGTLASLYLFHAAPSAHGRNQRPLPDPVDPSRFRRPPVPLQLRYLLTPLGSEEVTNQALLGRAIQHFHDNPFFETVSGAVIGDSFGGAPSEVRVAIEPLGFEQLTQLWNAFTSPYRLSLVFHVELVAIDSGLPAEHVPRTQEAVVLTGLKR